MLLPLEQREYIDTIMKNTEAKIILVLYSGCGAVDLSRSWRLSWRIGDYVHNDQVVAILGAGYPGMAGGKAIAEILVGEVNPSKGINPFSK